MGIYARTALRFAPAWRTSLFAPYRDIFEPYAPKLSDYVFHERARVPLWDIANGCILWLPERGQIRNEALLDSISRASPPEHFARPVLVVDVDIQGPTNGIVFYARLSTFSARGGLENYLRGNPSFYIRWLNLPVADTIFPISWQPCGDRYQNGNNILHLQDELYRTRNSQMEVGSCVSLKDGIFSVDANDIRMYQAYELNGYRNGKTLDGWGYRLDEASFEVVRQTIGLRSRPWLKSKDRMWDYFIEHTGIGTKDQLDALHCWQRKRDFYETNGKIQDEIDD